MIYKPITTDVVTITPSEGTIPKATGTTPSTVILNLYFVPTYVMNLSNIYEI